MTWISKLASAFRADAKTKASKTKALALVDGWENAYLGYGTSRDKVSFGYHGYSSRIDDFELSNLFYSDDIAAKLVEKRPEEAFRKGYKLVNPDNQDLALEMYQRGQELNFDAKMQEAFTWGRLWGGALLIIGAEGGQPWTPLVEEKVRDVRFLNVVDRRFAHVQEYYTNPLEPNYGQPKVYAIYAQAQGESVTRYVHESRVLRFDGLPVDALKRRELSGWSYSVLQRPYDVMRTFATAFQSAGVLTADASQAVFKMKGLFEMIASGEKERLQTRMRLVDMSRSSARAVLLDSDGEEFSRISTEFTGLPDMLDRMMMRLASSVDMPVTILMGRSPAGQNATGASDFAHWYDSIRTQQGKELTPKVRRFYNILSRGRLPNAQVEWAPLEEMTERESAEIAKYRAEAYKMYIDTGVLFPEEVALAEFGSGNGEIEIDEKARRESLEAEIDLVLNPPPPPPAVAPGLPAAPAVAPEAVAPEAGDEEDEGDASAVSEG